ncbi:uracil-DNA glycosylase [Castellaniella sp.]|uniref:uracil-DNA glycosylase n=1 Tax=Castellaniella sp. TaxID=1955812 RepID=UPI002AFDD23B|nr:uracil-DNA glycosylase [Castellaniella sp.]
MKPQLRPVQAAWLAEIGLDLHWVRIQPIAAPDVVQEPIAPPAHAKAAPPAAPAVRAPAPDQPAVRPRSTPAPDTVPLVAPVVDDADMAALAEVIRGCQQCARHQQRLRAVPGSGQAERPYYLIVAEQPGIDDEVAGQPFQGDSGRLLTAMLAAVRLPHADARYGTYVVKCRAPGGHEPDPAEVAACIPYLRREIALVQPHWILALGRVAAQAVLGGSADLDALRGMAHRYQPDSGPAIPVWVTHQPASLLVRSSLKAEAWRDLAGLAQTVRAE